MKEIIFLLSGPYIERDHERYGINLLKKNYSVKMLDYTAWINPNFWKLYSKKIFKSDEHIVISCKKDFLKFVSQINAAIVIDTMFNSNNKYTNWMKKLLKNKNCLFFDLDLGLIPLPKKNIGQILIDLFRTIIKPEKFAYKIYNILQKKYYNFIQQNSDFSISGGLVSLTTKQAKYNINAHAFDYDVYLDIKNKPKNSKSDYAVFLDEDIVFHPDGKFILDAEPALNVNQYYPTLFNFFKIFEIETGLKIKFAVHPKCYNENLPNLLKNIDYSIGNTAELVKNSSVVLLHSTTSVSYAIMFKKPTIFLTSNELSKSWLGPSIDNFAKILNSKLVNMNNNLNKQLDNQSLFKFDEIKYKNYLDKYLKVPNSPDIPLWEIFTEYLKNKRI